MESLAFLCLGFARHWNPGRYFICVLFLAPPSACSGGAIVFGLSCCDLLFSWYPLQAMYYQYQIYNLGCMALGNLFCVAVSQLPQSSYLKQLGNMFFPCKHVSAIKNYGADFAEIYTLSGLWDGHELFHFFLLLLHQVNFFCFFCLQFKKIKIKIPF